MRSQHYYCCIYSILPLAATKENGVSSGDLIPLLYIFRHLLQTHKQLGFDPLHLLYKTFAYIISMIRAYAIVFFEMTVNAAVIITLGGISMSDKKRRRILYLNRPRIRLRQIIPAALILSGLSAAVLMFIKNKL